MEKFIEYTAKVTALVNQVAVEEAKPISDSINMIQEAIKNENNIYVFGASHAGILTEELFYRAGGIAVINPIIEPSLQLGIRPITATSEMERLEGYGQVIVNKYQIHENDIIICHSVSGRNSVMIDFALAAKEKGAKIIAMTNVTYSKAMNSRHSNKLRLFEIADVTIDNHGEIGDACMSVQGLEQKVGPTSTVISTSIFNGIIAQVAEDIQASGKLCPILNSANVDGGDELNAQIFEKYKSMIHYMK